MVPNLKKNKNLKKKRVRGAGWEKEKKITNLRASQSATFEIVLEARGAVKKIEKLGREKTL